MQETGAEVIGLDWRIPLDTGWQSLGFKGAVQGNLDPVLLFADWKELKSRAENILRQAAGRPGHIFNLGHGILPETPVDNVKALCDYIREHSADFKTAVQKRRAEVAIMTLRILCDAMGLPSCRGAKVAGLSGRGDRLQSLRATVQMTRLPARPRRPVLLRQSGELVCRAASPRKPPCSCWPMAAPRTPTRFPSF